MINEKHYIDRHIEYQPERRKSFLLYCDFGQHNSYVDEDDDEDWYRICGDRCCTECYLKHVTRINTWEEEVAET